MYRNLGGKQHSGTGLDSSHPAALRDQAAPHLGFPACCLGWTAYTTVSVTVRLRISHNQLNWRSLYEWVLLGLLLLSSLPWILCILHCSALAQGFSQCYAPLSPHFSIPFFFLPWDAHSSLKTLFKHHLSGVFPDPHWQLTTNVSPFFHMKELYHNNQIDIICLLICPHH